MILECVSENIDLKKKIFGLIHKVHTTTKRRKNNKTHISTIRTSD